MLHGRSWRCLSFEFFNTRNKQYCMFDSEEVVESKCLYLFYGLKVCTDERFRFGRVFSTTYANSA